MPEAFVLVERPLALVVADPACVPVRRGRRARRAAGDGGLREGGVVGRAVHVGAGPGGGGLRRGLAGRPGRGGRHGLRLRRRPRPGAERCTAQTRSVVAALPDAAGYAVVPTQEGFTVADGGTACLVLGRPAATGGEVGRLRDMGTDLRVGRMSVGDCWIHEDLDNGHQAPLTDYATPHTDQVIGTVHAPDKNSYKNGVDNASKLCANKFESMWAPGAERVVVGWMTDEDNWNAGFTKIVCTVSRADNGKTTGKDTRARFGVRTVASPV